MCESFCTALLTATVTSAQQHFDKLRGKNEFAFAFAFASTAVDVQEEEEANSTESEREGKGREEEEGMIEQTNEANEHSVE